MVYLKRITPLTITSHSHLFTKHLSPWKKNRKCLEECNLPTTELINIFICLFFRLSSFLQCHSATHYIPQTPELSATKVSSDQIASPTHASNPSSQNNGRNFQGGVCWSHFHCRTKHLQHTTKKRFALAQSSSLQWAGYGLQIRQNFMKEGMEEQWCLWPSGSRERGESQRRFTFQGHTSMTYFLQLGPPFS